MKVEDAIERINAITDRQMEESAYHGGKQTRNEALDLAIDALEKQIPKKPIDWDDTERFFVKCVCGYMCDSRDFKKYCTKCGQALKF